MDRRRIESRPFVKGCLPLLGAACVWALVVWTTTSATVPLVALADKPAAVAENDTLAPAFVGCDLRDVLGVVDGDCRVCHQAEVNAWKNSTHSRSHERLFEPHARDYAAAIGIAARDIRRGSVCIRCHGTAHVPHNGQLRILSGVSCESCHGAAGGNPGWLNPHAVYGPNGTQPQEETDEHRQLRLEFCDGTGMVRPENTYQLARRCFGCHLVDIPELIAAGHSSGTTDFEFDAWSSGEVRHNFHNDQRSNAEAPSLLTQRQPISAIERKRVKYVVGLLVDLEMSLRSRARITRPEHAFLVRELAARIESTTHKLQPIGTEETASATQAVRSIADQLRDISVNSNADFLQAAETVSVCGQQFAARHDGSQLEHVDRLRTTIDPVGTPYSPE